MSTTALHRGRRSSIAIVALAGILLAACGGDDSAGNNAGVTTSTTEEQSTTTTELPTETIETTLGDSSPTTIAETGTTLPGGTPTTRRIGRVTTTTSKRRTATTVRTGGTTATTTDGSKRPANIDPNGVLRVGFDLAAQGGLKFDPTKQGAGQFIPTLPVLRPLLGRTADGGFKPEIAQSARVVDPSTVEVILRPNSKFSDGTDLDAAAVKATFFRNLDSKNETAMQIPDMGLVKQIDINSPTKLTIRTIKPAAGVIYGLLAGIEFSPMSPTSFTNGTNLNTEAVAAGPMKIVDYRANQRVTFVKNPYYWDAEHVYLAGMEFVHVTAGAATINGLRSGAIDWSLIDPDQAQNMQGNLTAELAKRTSSILIQWCVKDGTPLGNVKVRQAVNYAIDRDAFNGIVYGGRSSEAWDLFPPSSPYHNKSLDGLYPHNVAKAKQLLTEAGYPNGFKFSMAVPPTFQTIGEVLQSQLKEAGIDMNINISNNTGADYFTNVRFDSTVSNTRPGPYDKISRHFLSDSFSNACKYPVPQIDSLYAKVSGYAPDDPAAAPLWQKLSEVIFKDLAFMPQVTWYVNGYGYNTDRIGGLDVFYAGPNPRPDPAGTYIKKG